MKTLLEEAIESWQDARNGVIEEAENIPASKFDFRPTPEVRSVAELVVHILEVSTMMAGELTREDTNLQRYPWPKQLAHYAGDIQKLRAKRELVAALRRTLRDGLKEFRRAGEVHMLQQILRFDGQKGTRLAWFQHGIGHEEYHRGQLAVYARLIGLKPNGLKLNPSSAFGTFSPRGGEKGNKRRCWCKLPLAPLQRGEGGPERSEGPGEGVFSRLT